MRKTLTFSFLTLGISSLIAQVIIIRELLISFYGNELFVGWVLFLWLFFVGIGSLFLGRLSLVTKNSAISLFSCHISIIFLLPLTICLIRFYKIFMGGASGQIPDLVPSLLYAAAVLIPLSLLLGLQFAAGARYWADSKESVLSHTLGNAYLFETVGFLAGGLLFNFFLVFQNEFYGAAVLAIFNLISAYWVLKGLSGIRFFRVIWGLTFLFSLSLGSLSGRINHETQQFRFPAQQLIETKNTPYGNISVTRTGDQFNFYESGLLLGSNSEKEFTEQLIHLPLLYHLNPKKILLIGTGFNGAISEILKHHPEEIVYIELDPGLVPTAKRYIGGELLSGLTDNRVKVFAQDARYFLRTHDLVFDIIVINLPNPSTALVNRFYTRDFFKEAKRHLSVGGILSIHLTSSPNYLTEALTTENTSLFKTLKHVFNSVLILPEETNFFITSDSPLFLNPTPLIARFHNRAIQTHFVSEDFLNYRLTNDRVQKTTEQLNSDQKALLNLDELPRGYYYNLVYWLSYFHRNFAKLYTSLGKVSLPWVTCIIFVIFFLILFFVCKVKKSCAVTATFGMALAGFSLMGAEIVLIFAFQVFYGNIFHKIALLISALMVGMAVGTFLGNSKKDHSTLISLIRIHSLTILYFIFFLLLMKFLFIKQPIPSLLMEGLFYGLAAFSGGIVGYEFCIATRLFFGDRENNLETGTVYAADLLGACSGAVIISVVTIPLLGIYQTLILIALMNGAFLIPLFLFRKNLSGKNI